jgi:hypothetical protein
MKKLIFMIIASILFPASFLQAADTEPIKAEIIEKTSQRYFKIGDNEFVCNSDNRISENSAKEILKLVQRIYDKPSRQNKDDETIQAIWESLHKVCSGDVYDQILFMCLKYQLNNIFDYLRPTEKNIENTKRVYIARVLYVTKSIKPIIRGVIESSGEVGTRSYQNNRVNKTIGRAGYIDACIMGNCDHLKYIDEKWGDWDEDSHFRRPEDGSGADQRINAVIEELFNQMYLPIYNDAITKACDTFSGEIETLLSYWLDHCDTGSFISESEWDQLLIKLPESALNLPKGEDKKAPYDEGAVNLLSMKVLDVCLKYCKSEKVREYLISFGKQNEQKKEIDPMEKFMGKWNSKDDGAWIVVERDRTATWEGANLSGGLMKYWKNNQFNGSGHLEDGKLIMSVTWRLWTNNRSGDCQQVISQKVVFELGENNTLVGKGEVISNAMGGEGTCMQVSPSLEFEFKR